MPCIEKFFAKIPYMYSCHISWKSTYILPFYVPPPIDPISLCPLWHKLHHTSYLVICHTTKPSKNNMVSRNPKIFRFFVRASNKTIFFNHFWWPCVRNPIIKPIQVFMLFLRFYFNFSPKLTSASISSWNFQLWLLQEILLVAYFSLIQHLFRGNIIIDLIDWRYRKK